MMHFLRTTLQCVLCLAFFGHAFLFGAAPARAAELTNDSLRVGVYYFPGWLEGARGLQFSKPWEPIKAFPEREPLLGWYSEGDVAIMDQQLRWMVSHNLSFVVLDWYWDGRSSFLEHAARAYLQAPTRSQIPLALLWANHDKEPSSVESFRRMVQHWIDNYFRRPEYLTWQGKPLLFVFEGARLEERAKLFNSSAKKLIEEAQMMMRAEGLPPIAFVAGSQGGPGFTTDRAKAMGFAAYSAYNYHSGPHGQPPLSRSYEQLKDAYEAHWAWFTRGADMPYILPMTTGWDRRAWGGSRDPLHDQSTGTPQEFKDHLAKGKALMLAHPERTAGGMGVICCWNEYGEGSILEPTKRWGFQFLDSVRDIFAK